MQPTVLYTCSIILNFYDADDSPPSIKAILAIAKRLLATVPTYLPVQY